MIHKLYQLQNTTYLWSTNESFQAAVCFSKFDFKGQNLTRKMKTCDLDNRGNKFLRFQRNIIKVFTIFFISLKKQILRNNLQIILKEQLQVCLIIAINLDTKIVEGTVIDGILSIIQRKCPFKNLNLYIQTIRTLINVQDFIDYAHIPFRSRSLDSVSTTMQITHFARENRCCTRRFRSTDGACTGSLVDSGRQGACVV
ncbi:hypothetical protein pb186bvf_001436 [Paramecium bursaria]